MNIVIKLFQFFAISHKSITISMYIYVIKILFVLLGHTHVYEEDLNNRYLLFNLFNMNKL